MPVLENSMNNFMKCSQMMFGSQVKYGITYKMNQTSFTVYTRKYTHNFKVNVAQRNYEGSNCLSIKTMDAIIVSNIDEI